MALPHPRSKRHILPLSIALFFTAIATTVLLYTHNSGPIVIQIKQSSAYGGGSFVFRPLAHHSSPRTRSTETGKENYWACSLLAGQTTNNAPTLPQHGDMRTPSGEHQVYMSLTQAFIDPSVIEKQSLRGTIHSSWELVMRFKTGAHNTSQHVFVWLAVGKIANKDFNDIFRRCWSWEQEQTIK